MFMSLRALGGLAALALVSPAFLTAQTTNAIVGFGSVAIGTASAATTVTVAAPSTAHFTLSYGSEFALGTPSCSGGSCSVPVTFQPAYPGARRGAISVYNGTSLLSVTPLFGIGNGPQLNLGPGLITTVANRTNAQLATATLFGVAARGSNQIYLSDSTNNRVLSMVPSTGQVTVVAGTGTSGFSGDGGLATAARLAAPSGLAIDSSGNLLIADTGNNRIRKLNLTTGIITTVAGNGAAAFAGDTGLAVNASLNSPGALAIASNGDILIADTINYRVRLVSLGNGNIYTFAGSATPGFSGDGGPATSAQLNAPTGLAIDAYNNVYIADLQNNVIRMVDTNSTITTVAGQPGVSGASGDGGAATSATLNFPYGVAVDAAGDLYIGDDRNNVIRKVTGDASHIISTLAGTHTQGYLGDGGSALNAQLYGPTYMATDDLGNLYVLDSGNVAVRRVSAAPAPVTFAFTNVGSPSPSTVSISNTGNQTLNASAITLPANFTVGSGGTCSSTPSLLAGQSCTAVLEFTPASGAPTSGTVTVTSNSLNNPSASQPLFASQSNGLYFIPVAPCRVADTRFDTGFSGTTFAANTTRTYAIRNNPNCSGTIPSGADVRAYSLNVTVVPRTTLDFLTVAASIPSRPNFSTLNSYDGRTKANAALVPANLSTTNRTIDVYTTDATDVIIDINGYFVPEGTAGALAYFPLPPCRITDTRQAGNPGGPIMATGETRNFGLVGACNLPGTAQAYALNFTVVPQNFNGATGTGTPVPWLTAWPAGPGAQPVVSTLNATTGAVTANAAIVPAGTSGNISLFAKAATNVIIDVSGYYAPAATGGLALYSTSPCRAFDSRYVNSPSEQGAPINGVFNVDISTPCGVPAVAQEFVLNATVVPITSLGYLTVWARGSVQPLQSTLNAYDKAITSNLAVVPTSDGFVSSFTFAPTGLIFDLFGYFAP